MRNLIIILLFSVSTLSAQVEISKKENIMFQLLKTVKFFNNFHGPSYFDNHEYKFERLADGNLKVIPKNIQKINTDPLSGDKRAYYIIDEDHAQQSIVEIYNECNAQEGFIRINKWKDGRPVDISSRPNQAEGKITYNEKGLIKCFNDGLATTRKKNKKVFFRTYYCLQYDDQNRIQSAAKVIQNYKGKERKDLKTTNIFNEWEIHMTYNEDYITYTLSKFRDTEKEPSPYQKQEFKIYTENGQNIWTAKTLSGSPLAETHYKELSHSYGLNEQLKQRTEKKNSGTITDDYEYDVLNRIKKHTRQSNTRKEVYTNTYNEHNLLSEQIYEKFKDGALEELREIKLSYLPTKNQNTFTECNHKKEYFTKVYNGQKELIQEIKNNQIRVKENGVWGDWKFFQM